MRVIPYVILEQKIFDRFFFAFIVIFSQVCQRSKFIHVQLANRCFFKVCFLSKISLFVKRVVTHLSVPRDFISNLGVECLHVYLQFLQKQVAFFVQVGMCGSFRHSLDIMLGLGLPFL
ncbi:Hypothetical_protein [Hexamita inflata]|uniref:Hypothetical_protein n=1 Tax=Hexamita inflata TaxID=28002 RepID=A0AA86TIJ3_9EUKA|nr:Hypothetical protein HINF_LOCUS6210 [Hexamita inflata]